MRLDGQWKFVSDQTAPLSLVGADGVAIASTVIDLLGQGVGTAPANIIGNVTNFGTDLGIGDGPSKPKLNVTIGTALVTGNAATLNIAWQFAPDAGTPTYQPGAWQTVVESGPMTAAQLTAGAVVGRFDFPPAFPANLSPRFTRLLFSPAAATHFTAGTILFAGLTWVRDDQANKFAARNYKVQ